MDLLERRGSEISLDSSFTSKLLGGDADDDDDDLLPPPTNHHQQQEQQRPPPIVGGQVDNNSSSIINNNNNNNSCSSNLNRLIGSKSVDYIIIDDSVNNHRQGSYSDVGEGYSRGSSDTIPPSFKNSNRSRLLQGNNSNDKGGRERAVVGNQHSVSFSVEEDWKDHKDTNNSSNINNNHRDDNNSTLVPSSLGSLVSYASTRSSYSGRSNGGGSRSSKSSRGSGASTATGSTHSGESNQSPHAQQERRRRRELMPVKKTAKATKTSRITTTTAVNDAGETTMLMMGEEGGNGSDNGAFIGHRSLTSSSRRSRRNKLTSAVDNAGGAKGLALSRNLYSDRLGDKIIAEGGGATRRGKNLHDHHPLRYPKRSIDDEDNDENEDEEDHSDAEAPLGNAQKGRKSVSRTTKDTHTIAVGGAVGRGEDEVESSNGDEEDGLSKRVNRVRSELLHSKSHKITQGDFLDGLVASTTGQSGPHRSNNTKNSNNTLDDGYDNDGTASVGDTSFLSDFLTKNSAARQRKSGQPDQRSIRGSTTSNVYKKNDDGAQQPEQHQFPQHWHQGVQWLLDFAVKFYDHFMSLIRQSTIRHYVQRYYNEGGDILPRNRREIAIMLVWALLVLPLVRVVVIDAMDGGNHSELGVQSLLISADGDDIIADVWKESSIAMLSKLSSIHENFILIPDTVWIELQISRRKVQSSDNDSMKLPKRLPLPSVIDHDYSSPSSIVLFYVTAVNSTSLLLNNNINTNPSKRNIKLNTRLFESMQERLKPRPIDVWPCWAHNSLARFREDGLIVMYPAAKRREARITVKRLAKAFGQSTIYEFITTSDRTKSERRVGSDGSEIIIPGLRNGRSDVMLRRSLSTDPSDKDGAGPAVVMRRVKNLAVEDELTMREWEGPPLDQVI